MKICFIPMMVPAFTAIISGHALADIYKHVDENGHVTYSNLPAKGAKKIYLDPVASQHKSETKPAVSSIRPADFPKVDSATQKKRDDTRRRLLLDELGAEQKSLLDAQAELDQGHQLGPGEKPSSKSYLERTEKLQQMVSRHQRNIDAINRELATMR
jgi:Domain of unknown function (DUF4124)